MADQISTIPKEWKETSLGEVAEKIVDNRGKTPPIVSSGFELLEVNAISENQRTPDYSRVTKFVDEQTFNNWFRTGNISKSDILIPTVGTIGNVSFSKLSRGAIAQNLIAFRTDKNKADPLLIYYLLKTTHYKSQLLKLDIGGVQPSIKVPHLLGLEIKLPPLPEQRAIAEMLSSFDDKIEFLREQIKTLETIAQIIFKEWFVDFNFPGATGKMIGSELSKIPERWRIGKLGEFIDIRGGLSYDGNLISNKGIPMITMGFVSGEKRYEHSGLKYYIGDYKPQNEINVGSLVIATRDVTQDRRLIGSPAIIPDLFSGSKIIAATNLYIVDRISFLPNKFLYWLMRTSKYRERIIGACKGTTVIMITKDSILDFEFVVPPVKLVEKFSEVNESIFNKLGLIDEQIQTISSLRDALLPKLMKGELRVKSFND